MKLTKKLAQALLALTFATAIPGVAQAANPAKPAVVIEDVSRADFATTLAALKQQLADDGWNLVAEIDLGSRLAKKNVTIPGGLVILELTSGKNAVPLLKADATRYVSALMPCSISVYGMSDGRVMVSRMNSGLMADMLDPKVAEVMKTSATRLEESIARALAR